MNKPQIFMYRSTQLSMILLFLLSSIFSSTTLAAQSEGMSEIDEKLRVVAKERRELRDHLNDIDTQLEQGNPSKFKLKSEKEKLEKRFNELAFKMVELENQKNKKCQNEYDSSPSDNKSPLDEEILEEKVLLIKQYNAEVKFLHKLLLDCYIRLTKKMELLPDRLDNRHLQGIQVRRNLPIKVKKKIYLAAKERATLVDQFKDELNEELKVKIDPLPTADAVIKSISKPENGSLDLEIVKALKCKLAEAELIRKHLITKANETEEALENIVTTLKEEPKIKQKLIKFYSKMVEATYIPLQLKKEANELIKDMKANAIKDIKNFIERHFEAKDTQITHLFKLKVICDKRLVELKLAIQKSLPPIEAAFLKYQEDLNHLKNKQFDLKNFITESPSSEITDTPPYNFSTFSFNSYPETKAFINFKIKALEKDLEKEIKEFQIKVEQEYYKNSTLSQEFLETRISELKKKQESRIVQEQAFLISRLQVFHLAHHASYNYDKAIKKAKMDFPQFQYSRTFQNSSYEMDRHLKDFQFILKKTNNWQEMKSAYSDLKAFYDYKNAEVLNWATSATSQQQKSESALNAILELISQLRTTINTGITIWRDSEFHFKNLQGMKHHLYSLFKSKYEYFFDQFSNLQSDSSLGLMDSGTTRKIESLLGEAAAVKAEVGHHNDSHKSLLNISKSLIWAEDISLKIAALADTLKFEDQDELLATLGKLPEIIQNESRDLNRILNTIDPAFTNRLKSEDLEQQTSLLLKKCKTNLDLWLDSISTILSRTALSYDDLTTGNLPWLIENSTKGLSLLQALNHQMKLKPKLLGNKIYSGWRSFSMNYALTYLISVPQASFQDELAFEFTPDKIDSQQEQSEETVLTSSPHIYSLFSNNPIITSGLENYGTHLLPQYNIQSYSQY